MYERPPNLQGFAICHWGCLLCVNVCCLLQTETFDAEMEGLASNVKKNKKLPARHGHLDESINRHKQHIIRLEQMLRLLDNEVIVFIDDVECIKDEEGVHVKS